jgi:Pro-kumamolisin, activation domain/MBG domain (YGX type)
MEAYRRGGCRLRRVAPAALLVVALAVGSTAALGAGSASKAAAASTSGVGTGHERLPGHQGLVPPGATLVGPAPAATALPLVVTLKPRDPAALATAVQAISDPGSPQYRRFLTPAQFAQQFGPTTSTIRQVTSALRQEGLTVGAPSSTGLSLPVSGTVAQVQSAFATSISKYHLSSGKTGYDNASAPEVPTSVAPQIEGILGLDTLSPPQPSTGIPQASPAAPHPESAAVPAALAPGQPSPVTGDCATSISSVQSSVGALDAPELAQAYSFDSLYSSNDYGAGSTVALVEPSGTAGYSANDISTFANCYGITLGGAQVAQKTVGGGGATGVGTAEAELDIETVLSLAPKANIEVYEGGASSSLYNVFSQVVNDDTAKIVSSSWTNGCEAYVGQSLQNSENTLFQAAAAEGQSIFVATGDQGSEGCNINGKVSASTGMNPVAQAVDASTGTLYVANESSNTVSVDSEGSTGNPTNFGLASSVTTGTGPDAVALDAPAKKVFVANSGGTLTVISTTTCNQSTTSGCSSPQVVSDGHLNAPSALAVNGSTLYVGNGNGTVAVYNAGTNTWKATVNLASGSVPTALAVDPTNGFVYVADGPNDRIEYFSAATCNASATAGCSTAPTTVSVGNDPIALTVASTPGNLYVADAGNDGGRGIWVVSLSTHAVIKRISTSQPQNGTGVVQSIGLSPDNNEVLAVLNGLNFPGDVLATINTTTNAITATVALDTGTDSMGQLVSDPTLDYVWVTDQTSGGDVLQNLNIAVSDPASQPYVTAVGGTSLGHGTQTLGPPPTEQAWNDGQYFSEGAGGGGISKTFTMPAYQQAIGTVSGSSGTPCANAGGDCREVPDVSADADPSSGYVIYDSVNGLNWNALGGTSATAPLWAAVVAVVASANGNTVGYGALNPALYLLAQSSTGTYLNDVTTGNNDYNATDGGQFPAMPGYDMATGLGTPVASSLASGLTPAPLPVAVSGTQTYGGSPSFTAVPNFTGPGTMPSGVTLNTSGLDCTTVGTSTTISPTLKPGAYTLLASSCSGVTLTGGEAGYYSVVYTSAANDFTTVPAPLTITASSASMVYGSNPPPVTPTYTGFTNSDNASSLTTKPTCSTTASNVSTVSSSPYTTSCGGAADSNYSITYVPGTTTVTPAAIAVAVSGSQANSGTPRFTGTATSPAGVSIDTSALTCGQVSPSTPISGNLPSGSYTLVAGSCGGVNLSGANAANFALAYTSASGDFTVTGGPVTAPPPPPPPPPTYGYWLVGSDGGIFTFGSAHFYGSTGNLTLQRPVVGISPTANKAGYWLVASDGGVFAFGAAGYFGSIPGAGLNPAGSGLPHSLNAPIVGMVPSSDGGGYFMVASDGGVFAFGDARFEGSCPGIGGCSGAAVAVVPDASGNGYWLITQSGSVYAFGDAPFYGAPGGQGSPVTSAVRTADGHGYWVLLANGTVDAYGDAVARGGPIGSVGGFNPASAIFSDATGGGYWVATAQGAVFSYGDAPNDGSMAGTHLNGSIIAATGF